MKTHCILPLSYFGSIEYYSLMCSHEKVSLEQYEHFEKQTIRSYLAILGPNGVQKLSIPLKDRGKKIITKDIKISNDEAWQRVHFQSIITAYNSSPYFEHYQDYLMPIYNKKWDYLIDLNLATINAVKKLLKITNSVENTTEYKKDYSEGADFRKLKSFKKYQLSERDFKPYIQVFSDKHTFQKNLSILDLLFNNGNHSKAILTDLIADYFSKISLK